MAYCERKDIQSMYKDITFSVNTKVTKKEVEQFIDDWSQQIDARISKRYTTPVTGTKSKLVLKQVCIWFVVAQVDEILNQGKSIKRENFIRSMDYVKRAESQLKSIEKGITELSDAAAVSSEIFRNYVVDNNITSTIKKDSVQW